MSVIGSTSHCERRRLKFIELIVNHEPQVVEYFANPGRVWKDTFVLSFHTFPSIQKLVADKNAVVYFTGVMVLWRYVIFPQILYEFLNNELGLYI